MKIHSVIESLGGSIHIAIDDRLRTYIADPSGSLVPSMFSEAVEELFRCQSAGEVGRDAFITGDGLAMMASAVVGRLKADEEAGKYITA